MPHQPQRTCVACRSVQAPAQMLRVAAQFGQAPCLDDAGKEKAPGRGAYLCRKPECARIAWKKRAFERALKLKTPLDASLKEQVETAIDRQLTQITSQESQTMN